MTPRADTEALRSLIQDLVTRDGGEIDRQFGSHGRANDLFRGVGACCDAAYRDLDPAAEYVVQETLGRLYKLSGCRW